MPEIFERIRLLTPPTETVDLTLAHAPIQLVRTVTWMDHQPPLACPVHAVEASTGQVRLALSALPGAQLWVWLTFDVVYVLP